MLWIATLVVGGTFAVLIIMADSPNFTAVITLASGLSGAVVGHYFAMRQAAQGGRTAINAANGSVTTVQTPDPATKMVTVTGPTATLPAQQ